MTKKCASILLALVAIISMSSTAHAQGVLPLNAHYRGLSQSEWAAVFWQTAVAVPVENGDHPFISGGAIQGPEGMVFLTGVFSEEPAIVEITIPAGTPLFFPVINVECSVAEPDPFHGDDEQELRACANEHMDQASGLFAFVNGRPVKNLTDYRSDTPLFLWGPVPENNIVGVEGGTVSPAVGAGYHLLLSPLGVGQHVIHFGGTFDHFGASINTIYIVTVVP